jgi:hypothetical protein
MVQRVAGLVIDALEATGGIAPFDVHRRTDWPDDVAETGDAYFFPAGHTLVYEEESECLEFNPAAALVSVMDHFERMLTGEWSVRGGS